MKISELKKAARLRLKPYGKKPFELAFFTFAITMAAQLVVNAIGYAVSNYQGGEGLDGMGMASFLQTLEELLGTGVQVLSPMWILGLTAAMMSFMDWQEASRDTLLTGLRRLWPFTKLYMLEIVLCFFAMLAVFLPISILLSMNPWAQELMTIPEQGNMDDVAYIALLLKTIAPFMITFFLALIAVMAFLTYRLRFAQYMLLSGWIGVMNAMLTSFRLTKGHVWAMVKLDLSYWWYYLASGLLIGVYIGVPLLSFELGLSNAAAFWLSYAIYALGRLALDVFVQPRILAANVMIYRGAMGKD